MYAYSNITRCPACGSQVSLGEQVKGRCDDCRRRLPPPRREQPLWVEEPGDETPRPVKSTRHAAWVSSDDILAVAVALILLALFYFWLVW